MRNLELLHMFSFAIENGNIIAIATTQLGKRYKILHFSVLNLTSKAFILHWFINLFLTNRGKYSDAEETRTADNFMFEWTLVNLELLHIFRFAM